MIDENVSDLRPTRKMHGKSRTPEYEIWKGMKARCSNPKHKGYKNYGERDIKVCEKWDSSFEAFLEDVGLRPAPGYSLERIDNNKGYELGNVKWATSAEQGSNKRNNRHLTAFGRTQTLAEWTRETGLWHGLIRFRIGAGRTVEQALSDPVPPRENHRQAGVTAFGKTMGVAAWARETGIAFDTLYYRIVKRGMSPEEALSTPVKSRPK